MLGDAPPLSLPACITQAAAALRGSPLARHFSWRVLSSDGDGDAAAAPSSPTLLPPLLVRCVPSSALDDAALDGGTAPASGRGFFTLHDGVAHISLFHDRLDAGGSDLRTLLAHELTHAVDAGVHGLDLATCGALACSELRAAASAECAAAWPAWSRRACARETAARSTRIVFPAQGAACVAAMDACVLVLPGDSPARVVAGVMGGGGRVPTA